MSALVRPTTVTVLFAILGSRDPRRLLVAYVAAGVTGALAAGVIVVALLQGLNDQTASTTSRPVIGIVLGAAALVYSAAAWVRWPIPWPRLPARREPTEPGTGRPGLLRRRLQRLTLPGAAGIGVLTHLPGVTYLAALNAIVASATGLADGVLQVMVYVAIWFTLPVSALVMALRRPGAAEALLARLAAWAQLRRRPITVLFFGGLGGYLLGSGIAGLGT